MTATLITFSTGLMMDRPHPLNIYTLILHSFKYNFSQPHLDTPTHTNIKLSITSTHICSISTHTYSYPKDSYPLLTPIHFHQHPSPLTDTHPRASTLTHSDQYPLTPSIPTYSLTHATVIGEETEEVESGHTHARL